MSVMPNLDEISERLFIRSQEAVLQLELWIRGQQHLSEIEHESAGNKLADQYNLYMAQLNSLCVRSEYVRNKLNKGCYHRPSVVNEETYIEDLVYEFQDLTLKLNELAQKQKEQCTPSSKSSNGSDYSFLPRPLKITERHRADVRATRQSPIKESKKTKTVNFSQTALGDDGLSYPSRCTSLPGSPVKVISPAKALRAAKSYDTGLNPNMGVKLKKQREDEMLSFFKENQRLSITFCDDIDDDDSDSASDQNTVISNSSAFENIAKPLRKYNSHDSILSTKVHYVSSVRSPSFLSMPMANRPSMKSAIVSSAPVISTTAGKARSKDLLTLFVSDTPKQGTKLKKNAKSNPNSFWNFFKSPSQSIATFRGPWMESALHREMSSAKILAPPSCGVYSSCSKQMVGSRLLKITPPVSRPFNDGSLVYEELQEALNTELIL